MSTRRALAFLALLAAVAASTAAAQQPPLLDAASLRAAIERALQIAPRGFEALLAPAQTGVRVVEVVRKTAALTGGAGDVEYRFLVDGLPLDQFLESRVRIDSRRTRGSGTGPVVVSAGHGWYWHERSASWHLQRDYFWGIVEDFVNWELAQYVRQELSAAGFASRPARQPDRGAPQGASGHPGWQEAAVYF